MTIKSELKRIFLRSKPYHNHYENHQNTGRHHCFLSSHSLNLKLITPGHTHVDRSVTISALCGHVWSYLNNFNGMAKWSPWTELAPNKVTTFENDIAFGALHTWAGNDSVGRGEQTITSMTDNQVVTHLHFIKPFHAEADATTIVIETEEGI